MGKDKFKEDITTQGYAIVENVLSPQFVVKVKNELELAIKKEVEYHQTNQYSDFGKIGRASCRERVCYAV